MDTFTFFFFFPSNPHFSFIQIFINFTQPLLRLRGAVVSESNQKSAGLGLNLGLSNRPVLSEMVVLSFRKVNKGYLWRPEEGRLWRPECYIGLVSFWRIPQHRLKGPTRRRWASPPRAAMAHVYPYLTSKSLSLKVKELATFQMILSSSMIQY